MYKKKKIQDSIPKPILIFGKILQFFSLNAATKFSILMFTTPFKHHLPNREKTMFNTSIKSKFYVKSIKKTINIYKYGKSNRAILLVHGWSGRGTQLVKIAEQLIHSDYQTISFDAPAHGLSQGKRTSMYDFIECIKEIDKSFGPFDALIGHSLGAMSVFNAMAKGVNCQTAIAISSGNSVRQIVNSFVNRMQLNPKISSKINTHFLKKFGESMENYSAYIACRNITKPILLIHDLKDTDVPASASIEIDQVLKHSTLLLTEGLGHRKILGDQVVINTIIQFIMKNHI